MAKSEKKETKAKAKALKPGEGVKLVSDAFEALAAKKAADKARGETLDPEVLPRGSSADPERFGIVKHAEDFSALERIEASIQRDIALSGKLDKAGAMVGIKIGLALQAGKTLLKHGEFEGWVSCKFGEAFSERKAQYFSKLAGAFLRSGEGAALAMPKASEAGNWLVVADEGSALQASVAAFVGDLTLGELLDKHGVRPAKAKGGWRPADWLVAQYQGEHEHLKNRAFDIWSKEDQEAFKQWQEKQVAGDDAAARRMAAEATWHGLRATLADHGLGRKTWSLIPREQLEETHAILGEVYKGIGKAVKKEA